MWTKKKKLWYVLYKIFAAKLPESRRFPLAKNLRSFFSKKIIAYQGEKVNIEKNASFTPELRLGDYSGVGINCEVNGPVTIGKYVMMGPEVVIYTNGHNFERTDIPMQQQGNTETKPVVIEDDVWIGRRAMIMPGVHIGKGCVIGAGAVVTKDIPDYSVVGGVPAQILKRRIES